MRKNAWVICCCTAVLSAFGIFFRWLQDQACFEAETGLAVRGSIWPYAVALMIVIAAVVLAVVCFRMKNQPHTSFPDSLPAAFAASKRARAVGGVLLGAMLALGGLWLLRMEDLDPPREMPGAQDAILRSLETYGFEWDGALVRQSERHAEYAALIQRLFAQGLAYACTCSRSFSTRAFNDMGHLPVTSSRDASGITLPTHPPSARGSAP